jgi:hypothetical protein
VPKCTVGNPRARFASGPPVAEVSEEIKARITIPILGEKLFPGWRAGRSCLSPFRDEKNPSFSVYADDSRFHDYATGEDGDVFDFYRLAIGCTPKEAFLAVKEMAGGKVFNARPIPIRAASPEEKKEQFHPELTQPSHADLDRISSLRSISPIGLDIAVGRGFLWTAALKGQRAFVVTDRTRKNYRARRMDGKPWEHLESKPKAYAVSGSQAAWPIGIEEAQAFPAIALCEGEGDFLAAFYHAYAGDVEDRVAPVCISGAGNRIPAEALPLFKDKRVRIFVQDDRAGEEAWERWAKQLNSIAGKIDGFSFGGLVDTEGSPITDLNDLLRVDSDCWEENRDLIESVLAL